MPPKGQHLTEEQKARLSASRTGWKDSEETRQKKALASTGRTRSAESRAAMSLKMKGRIFSPETIEKMRLAHAGQAGARNGQHHTEEAKELLRQARVNQVHPRLAKRGITIEMVREAESSGLKWCAGKCKSFVPVTQFAGDQTHGKCKLCVGAKMQDRRDAQTNEEKAAFAEWISKWRVDNCDQVRAAWMKKRYGVTPEWYDARLAEQGGHCALCPSVVDERALHSKTLIGERKYLLIDHDHETGKARGLLCAKCNTALHRVEYVDDWALKALDYLKFHGSDRKSKAEWLAKEAARLAEECFRDLPSSPTPQIENMTFVPGPIVSRPGVDKDGAAVSMPAGFLHVRGCPCAACVSNGNSVRV